MSGIDNKPYKLPEELYPLHKIFKKAVVAAMSEYVEAGLKLDLKLTNYQLHNSTSIFLLEIAAMQACLNRRVFEGGEPSKERWGEEAGQAFDWAVKMSIKRLKMVWREKE